MHDSLCNNTINLEVSFPVLWKIVWNIMTLHVYQTMTVMTEFDPANAQGLNSILIIGKRAVGKTTLVHDLMKHMSLTDALVFNPTEGVAKEYAEIVTEQSIHEEYDCNILDAYIEERLNLLKQSDESKACIVFESCWWDGRWKHQDPIKKLYMNGKHMQINQIVTMQYPMEMPSAFLENTDYVFIFRENNVSNRKRLYERFGGVLQSFESFCTALDSITEDPYSCMVIHNCARSDKTAELVMRYKVKV